MNKKNNGLKQTAIACFVIGTALILAKMFLTDVITLSDGIWTLLVATGTALDAIAGIMFLRIKKGVDDEDY